MIRILDWSRLTPGQREGELERPSRREQENTLADARRIVDAVRSEGDTVLRRLTLELDGADLERFEVGERELAEAETALSGAEQEALEQAVANVRRFHEAQRFPDRVVETFPGVRCELLVRPIDKVGLYVPAGSAPLPSTAIMLAVPAELAGCPLRILCTPPRRDGTADPAILVAARLCGVGRVFKLGGAQAIAAMAYGTDSVPKVDKVFGPGNAWVAAAKQLVANDPRGAACDLPAGPSEVLVIADDQARAEFVAADLLAQAEHGVDAQVLLITPSRRLAGEVQRALSSQAATLSRRELCRKALGAACILVVPDLYTALDVCNEYAPEHLILEIADPRAWLERVRSAGSVFLGSWSPEPMGDYCTGTNHVLPTSGFARACSGLSLFDFTKRMSVQELSTEGLRRLGPTAISLATLEGLDGHARAISLRLQALGAEVAT